MKRAVPCFVCYLLFAFCICMGFSVPVYAQSTELTSHDNHALLYAHQLGFSSAGTPTVRMRIADGLDKLRFTPQGDFTVMMSGSGGAVIHLKGNKTYEVTLSSPKPGQYQYGVIVARSETPDGLSGAKNRCESERIDSEIVPIGSVFALKGHVFDNRENLLMTRRQPNEKEAQTLMSRVPVDSSVDGAEIHRELLEYPTARLSLKDESGNIQIDHQNLLWIDLPESGAKLYDIEGENGKKGELVVNSQIIVTPDQSGRLAVVQSADVETILRGIVPAEVYASAPEAALMAQAVAARTTLIAQVGARHSADPYHLCNKQHCQVYRGLSGADPRTDKAIEKTRGQILFSDKKLVQSYYSSHCGGISAGSQETWGLPEKSYLVARTDDPREASLKFKNDEDLLKWIQSSESEDYCDHAPKGQKSFTSTQYAHWDLTLPSSELESRILKAGYDVGHIKNIEVLERGKSYRVTKIRVTGTKSTIEVERELPIRKIFGGLKSALFVMQIDKSGDSVRSITFYGSGFGHGVGMCQTGAIGMAQRGLTYADILKHYYPGTRLETLW